MSTTVRSTYYSEFFQKAEAKGLAEGQAEAVLTVLEARGVTVSDAIREQVRACSDLVQLDTWLRRATTASAAEDVVRP